MFGLTRWLDSGTAARRVRKVVLGLVLVGLAAAILVPAAAAGAAAHVARDDAKAGIAPPAFLASEERKHIDSPQRVEYKLMKSKDFWQRLLCGCSLVAQASRT